jgi:hypothetical protein
MLTVSGFAATIQYNPAAVAIQFTPIPEPAHLLAVCAGPAAFAWWRRRQSRARTSRTAG